MSDHAGDQFRWHWNGFHITVPLWGESTGKSKLLSEHFINWWFETPWCSCCIIIMELIIVLSKWQFHKCRVHKLDCNCPCKCSGTKQSLPQALLLVKVNKNTYISVVHFSFPIDKRTFAFTFYTIPLTWYIIWCWNDTFETKSFYFTIGIS